MKPYWTEWYVAFDKCYLSHAGHKETSSIRRRRRTISWLFVKTLYYFFLTLLLNMCITCKICSIYPITPFTGWCERPTNTQRKKWIIITFKLSVQINDVCPMSNGADRDISDVSKGISEGFGHPSRNNYLKENMWQFPGFGSDTSMVKRTNLCGMYQMFLYLLIQRCPITKLWYVPNLLT